MKRTHPWVVALLAGAVAVAPVGARAEPANQEASAKDEARDRFDRGLTLFNEGDNSGALAEFKRAYELIPNPLVLFNIGLVYAAMSRPVEAMDALDRVLKQPGTLSPERIETARRTRAEQAQRVAELTVTTNVPCTILIDNVEAGKTPLTVPLRVSSGTHIVGGIAAGYAPLNKEVTIAGGTKQTLQLDLVEMEGRAAHLDVKTHLPGADVLVDGQVVGHTPLAQSLTVAPGQHRVELRRPGYAAARQDLLLGDGASAEVTFDPEEDRAALAAEGGTLALDISETQAAVTIDGKPRGTYQGSYSLAHGVHHLLVERGGFRSTERDVNVDKGRTTTITVTLEPTPETRAAYVGKATSQRTWGWIATIGGVAIAGGGVGYLVINSGKKSDAQSAFDAAQNQVDHPVPGSVCDVGGTGGDAKQCNQKLLDARDHLDSVKANDKFGYIGIGVGVAATALGVVLLVTGDDPHRYDHKIESARGPRIIPFGWRSAEGGGLGISGAF